jgi:uncharacterized Zn-finger protein
MASTAELNLCHPQVFVDMLHVSGGNPITKVA